jgi:choline dehydrogenase-like flavoprotein
VVDVKKLLGEKAIVIGASIAGLLSARVLADYFQQVLILERDQLPETPEARRGVPQSVQPHVLCRSSQAAQWLQEINYPAVPETVVNPFLGYATRRYQLPANFKPDWKVLLISQTPPESTRLGYLARIENDEVIATLGGYGKDFPPLDDLGFLEFAQSLAIARFLSGDR